jgi:hypothetical protein
MADRFPGDTTQWVFSGGAWQPAGKAADLAHYTNATLFVNNGRVIDGRATGLSNEDFNALQARYPDEVVQTGDGVFTLPFVPVGTVVDITPQAAAAAPPSRAARKPRTGRRK